MPPPRLLCYTNSMFLQTLVQLNILILATPALAGWTLMPVSQPGAVRAACVVWQYQAIESVAPKTDQIQTALIRQASRPQPLALPHPIILGTNLSADQAIAFAGIPTAALISFNPFPHATRAP